jgi:predicted pyridoxine 5'-phosphate oxidase superfamily flavin-nucleotide-binding protein
MTAPWFEQVRSLLELLLLPLLATYRKNGSAFVSPVWFRWRDGGFEVVIAEGDLKGRADQG